MEQKDFFSDKTLLITGGTGSFGSTVLKRFLTSDIEQIRIFSRDEQKQDAVDQMVFMTEIPRRTAMRSSLRRSVIQR